MLHALRRVFPEPVAVKVPEITLIFWVVKIVTTAGGEAGSDYLALGSIGKVVGGAIEVLLLLVALAWQFRTRRYHAAAYWFLAYAIAVAGTGIADFMHLYLGIPYAGTSVLWAIVLAVVFVAWHRSERTLSIHSVTTTRRECFYWATVFSTFALGTALGDFTAASLGLGFFGSAVLFFVIILLPALSWWRFELNGVVAFWCSYVVTRPLGASIADYLSKPRSLSGIDLGNGPVALAFLALLALLVGYLLVARPNGGPAGAHVRGRADTRPRVDVGTVRHLGGVTVPVDRPDPPGERAKAGARPVHGVSRPAAARPVAVVDTEPLPARPRHSPGGGHVVIRRDRI